MNNYAPTDPVQAVGWKEAEVAERCPTQDCNWLFHEHDAFCSRCGRDLFAELEPTVTAQRFYALSDQDQSCELCLVYTGAQDLPIGLPVLSGDADWLIPATGSRRNGDDLVLSPDGLTQHTFSFLIKKGYSCPANGCTAKVEICSPVKDRNHSLEVILVPEPQVAGDVLRTAVTVGVDMEGRVDGELELARNVQIDSARFDCLGLRPEPAGPARLDENGRLEIPVSFDLEQLQSVSFRYEQGRAQDAIVKGIVFVQVRDRPGEMKWQVQLTVSQPGSLDVDSEPLFIDPPLYSGLGESKRPFVIRNLGGKPVRITSVTLSSSKSDAAAVVNYARLAIEAKLPLILAPGEVVSCELYVNTSQLAPGELEKAYPLWLHVDSDALKPWEPLDLQFDVKALPEAVIAIDFGTTNTCIAWAPQGGVGKLAMLEKMKEEDSQGKETSPSVIWFQDVCVQPPVYVVGEKAAVQMGAPGVQGAIIRSIKSRLGSMQKESVWANKHRAFYTPAEVAGFILGEFVQRLRKDSVHQLARCVAAVPPTFSEAQRADLLDACQKAGIDRKRITALVDEPVAAAIEFILRRGAGEKEKVETKFQDGPWPPYMLAVCDAGGGTTDLTLLLVDDHRNIDQCGDVEVEVLFAGGTPCFGGDRITDELAGLIYDRAAEKWAKQENGRSVQGFKRQVPAEASSNRDVARENWRLLWNVADQVKKALSSKAETDTRPFEMNGAHGQAATIEQQRITQEDLRSCIQIKLEVLAETLRRAIALFQKKRRELAKGPRFLLMAGQTSQLPIVRDEIRKACPGEDTELIFEVSSCKRCVGIGALQMAMRDPRVVPRLTNRIIVKSTENLCPTTIGTDGAGELQPIIRQFDPLNEEYLVDDPFPVADLATREFSLHEHFGMDMVTRGPMSRELGVIRFEPLEGIDPLKLVEVKLRLDPLGRDIELKAYVDGKMRGRGSLSR